MRCSATKPQQIAPNRYVSLGTITDPMLVHADRHFPALVELTDEHLNIADNNSEMFSEGLLLMSKGNKLAYFTYPNVEVPGLAIVGAEALNAVSVLVDFIDSQIS